MVYLKMCGQGWLNGSCIFTSSLQMLAGSHRLTKDSVVNKAAHGSFQITAALFHVCALCLPSRVLQVRDWAYMGWGLGIYGLGTRVIRVRD